MHARWNRKVNAPVCVRFQNSRDRAHRPESERRRSLLGSQWEARPIISLQFDFAVEWQVSYYLRVMTLILPDDPALAGFSEPDLRLGLACGLFSSGSVARGVAARIAGLDRRAFDEALFSRRIPSFTEEMLDEDVSGLKTLFPR